VSRYVDDLAGTAEMKVYFENMKKKKEICISATKINVVVEVFSAWRNVATLKGN